MTIGQDPMNQALDKLSHTWRPIQSFLFPMIWEELGELTEKQKRLVSVLELAKLEQHLPDAGRCPGRPLEDRGAMARAFVAKRVYDMATTRILLDRGGNQPNGAPSLRLAAPGGCAERIHLVSCFCRICRESFTRTGTSGAD